MIFSEQLKDSYKSNDYYHDNMAYLQHIDGLNALVFDDDKYTIWIIWRETKSCQKNMY